MVIAIIAVLASLLLPALSKAKEKAQAIDCVSRVKQLGLAMQMYGDDHADLLPMADGAVPWLSTNPVPWTAPLLRYYRDTNVLRCPALSQHYQKSPFDYFMGARAVYVETGQRGSVRLGRIKLPAQYILSGDANYPFESYDADPDNYSQDAAFQFVSPVHNRRVNLLFADGHARPYAKFNPAEMTFGYELPGVPFE